MPASEAHLDAPRALRRVRYRGHFTDCIRGVAFIGGAAQSGMPEAVLSQLLGIGLPLDDLGPWEPAAIAAPPAVEPVAPPSAALPSEPAPPDAPVVSPAHAAPPAPSPLPPPRPFTPTHRRR